ncbi:LysR family transcriptional regulator [Serratia sp. AKBS12]|uniref:LysR family transcriptional regulator n=1 Tax=Serratia sp. AKBS12 TaxID=2974597 RepID=UPI0021667544|nr:LysR family transcriptional regulator [Serratia sp. AKBS12]MCS3407570.1 LysR family transcriptional regulator [Serratia sp. AKBS12]
MTDRFEELKTYVAVVEAGGFAAASRRLTLAKSAISRRVRDLETRLGSPLMNRSTRQIHLTDAGQEFYEQARRILAELNDAENAVSEKHTDLQGRLRISAPVSLTAHCLIRVIDRFVTANPRLSLEFDTDDKMTDIIRDGFDLAIRIANLRDSSLIARRITTVRHVCCASPSLLERYGRPNQVDDLAAMPGIRYSNVEESRYWSFSNDRAPIMKSQLCFSNGDAIREAAIAGLGVAMLPTFIAHDAIRRGELEIVLREHMRPPIGMYAVFPSSKQIPAKIRAFIDFLLANLGDEPFWDRDILSRAEINRFSTNGGSLTVKRS